MELCPKIKENILFRFYVFKLFGSEVIAGWSCIIFIKHGLNIELEVMKHKLTFLKAKI